MPRASMDCGSNSCRNAGIKGGTRVNGPCSCAEKYADAIAERDAYRAALAELVETSARCWNAGCDGLVMGTDGAGAPLCDACGALGAFWPSRTAAPLRAALALLKGPA